MVYCILWNLEYIGNMRLFLDNLTSPFFLWYINVLHSEHNPFPDAHSAIVVCCQKSLLCSYYFDSTISTDFVIKMRMLPLSEDARRLLLRGSLLDSIAVTATAPRNPLIGKTHILRNPSYENAIVYTMHKCCVCDLFYTWLWSIVKRYSVTLHRLILDPSHNPSIRLVCWCCRHLYFSFCWYRRLVYQGGSEEHAIVPANMACRETWVAG